MGLFDEVDNITGVNDCEIVKAPFGFPGGKTRSIKHILPHLPHRNSYIEPFGGSAALLLAKSPSKIEIYNDRNSGVVDFYRCIKDPRLLDAIVDWLEVTVQSREQFLIDRDTWKDVDDIVERAARWYYMTVYSFGALGRNFGRAVRGTTGTAGMIQRKLPMFAALHQRLKNVIIENRDALKLIEECDDPNAVFYLDPPYCDAYTHTYKHEMSHDQHRELIDLIFSLEGYVAVSGFSNPLYENQDWDERHDWEVFCSISPVGGGAGNNKALIDQTRKNQEEVLWIKY